MKFGAVPLKEALGATAVHSIRQDGLVLKKGTLIGPAEVVALEAAGIKEVVVARLEPDDIAEDVAAAEIAKAVATPEVKDKMFNPFFTTKPAGEGTGLGLSMSHDIVVKQHGGRIDVETEPGHFTEFIIVLPRANNFPGKSGG